MAREIPLQSLQILSMTGVKQFLTAVCQLTGKEEIWQFLIIYFQL